MRNISDKTCRENQNTRFTFCSFFFLCTEKVAFSYIFLKRSTNQSRSPYAFRMVNRYRCESLSKASLKSKDVMHRGVRVISDCAIASRTVTTASSMELPGTP